MEYGSSSHRNNGFWTLPTCLLHVFVWFWQSGKHNVLLWVLYTFPGLVASFIWYVMFELCNFFPFKCKRVLLVLWIGWIKIMLRNTLHGTNEIFQLAEQLTQGTLLGPNKSVQLAKQVEFDNFVTCWTIIFRLEENKEIYTLWYWFYLNVSCSVNQELLA